MPRISVPGFAGPANALPSVQADAEDTHNLFPCLVSPGTPQKSAVYFRQCPGVVPYAFVDDSPGRFTFQEDDRAFGVTGSSFWEVFPNGTTTIWGTVASGSTQVSIVSNGTAGGQLLIVTGGRGWVFTLLTNTLIELTTANFPGTAFPAGMAQCCEFIDGVGIVTLRSSRRFYFSAREDFTSWDPLDFFERSEGSDNIVAVRRNGRDLWFPGSQTGEIWASIDDALFPFQPLPGVFQDRVGVANPMAFIRYRDGLAWLESNAYGAGVVKVSNGYQGVRISTEAVEADIQTADAINLSFLFAQQQDGHEFLWLLLPELQWTWVYDGTVGLWHKRDRWNPITCHWEPHLAQSCMYAFGGTSDAVPLVVSRLNGTIYQLSFSAYDNSVVP